MTGAVQSTFADRIDWIQYWIFIFNLSLNRIQTLPLSFEKANLCGQAVYTFFNSLALAVDTYGLWWVERCVEFLQSSDAVFPFPPMWHEFVSSCFTVLTSFFWKMPYLFVFCTNLIPASSLMTMWKNTVRRRSDRLWYLPEILEE